MALLREAWAGRKLRELCFAFILHLSKVPAFSFEKSMLQIMTFQHLPASRFQVTFEDKKRENFERGSLELEKRRQALLEQQRKEHERLAQLERAEQERKERERHEQERKRQLELEKQLEKQRELERQREEERRKEIERREVSRCGAHDGRVCSCRPSSLSIRVIDHHGPLFSFYSSLVLVYSQSCATIATVLIPEHCPHPKKKCLTHKAVTPQPSAATN